MRTLSLAGLASALAVLALALAAWVGLATYQHAGSNDPSVSNSSISTVSYDGLQFIIGPGSTETFFHIKDQSRPPTVVWTCGFIHNFVKNQFGGYTPEVSCNR